MAISDLLGKLQSINNSNLIDVFVPSQGRFIKFKQLSVKQQKDLIKTGLDGALAGATMSNVLNTIISENSSEPIEYNIFDRSPVIVNLRIQSFGSSYTQDDKQLDLSVISQQMLQFDTPSSNIIRYDNTIQVKVGVPALKKDTAINNSLIAQIKKNQDIGVGDAVGSLYMYELLKFVEAVDVAGNVIDFDKCSVADGLTVVENLPAKILVELVEFIQLFRNKEVEYLTIDGTTLALDARMFAQ
jgi:hypothetical protein